MGDWGLSRSNDGPVLQGLLERAPFSLALGLFALVVALVLAIAAILAERHVKILSRPVRCVVYACGCVPFFAVALAFQMIAVHNPWLPTAGVASSGEPNLSDVLLHLLLPGGAAALAILVPIFERLRSLPYPYAVSGVLPTVVEVFPYALAVLMLIEPIYAMPGFGRIVFQGLRLGDIRLTQGYLLFAALAVVAVRLVADSAAIMLESAPGE